MFVKIPPMPVPDLLGNNNVPSPSETKLIHAAMHGVHHDLRRLSSEINRVQTLLSNLMRNRDLLCRYYYCQRALLAPVRRLPPEILSQIFLACLTFYHEGNFVFSPRKDVLLLGQICRYWRDVAISTPRLWSTLRVDLRVQNMDRELEMTSKWLAHSGGAPLTVLLCDYHETTRLPRTIVQHSNLRELYVDVADLATLFENLSLPALVTLSLFGHKTWPQQGFLSFLRRSSCLLQKLSLGASVCDSENWIDFSDGFTECLQHMPNLSELVLLEGIGPVIERTFWTNLTHRISSPCLVPKLRRITITRDFVFDYEEFVDMVESRWRVQFGQGAAHVTVERIQSVEVYLMDDHERYDAYNNLRGYSGSSRSFARLRQFRAEGLNVIAPDIDAEDSSSGSESSDE
jgi:hypothetical protein